MVGARLPDPLGWLSSIEGIPDSAVTVVTSVVRVPVTRKSSGVLRSRARAAVPRQSSYSTLSFDRVSGEFLWTVKLIRADLYQGQPCGSGGEPYRFIALIGYYECVHA